MRPMELRRAPSETPTEPGWYYAEHPDLTDGIEPIQVRERYGKLHGPLGTSLKEYRWFGPVPVCVESGI